MHGGGTSRLQGDGGADMVSWLVKAARFLFSDSSDGEFLVVVGNVEWERSEETELWLLKATLMLDPLPGDRRMLRGKQVPLYGASLNIPKLNVIAPDRNLRHGESLEDAQPTQLDDLDEPGLPVYWAQPYTFEFEFAKRPDDGSYTAQLAYTYWSPHRYARWVESDSDSFQIQLR